MVVVTEVKCTKARTNVFHVPAKQWRHWSVQSRQVFNEVYSSMQNHPDLFMHPKRAPVSNPHWATTCWNAAWTAANAAG